jgi:hypothetical protein
MLRRAGLDHTTAPTSWSRMIRGTSVSVAEGSTVSGSWVMTSATFGGMKPAVDHARRQATLTLLACNPVASREPRVRGTCSRATTTRS